MPPAELCWPSLGHAIPYQIGSIRVCNRTLGSTVEHHIPEMGMSIQAAQIRLAEVHQNLVRALPVSGFLAVDSLSDWVGIWIWVSRVHARQDVFQNFLRVIRNRPLQLTDRQASA